MKPTTPYQSVFAPGLLRGQVILVTGGGSGIGRCTAHELANLGAQVVLVGRNPDKLTATAQEIIGDGGQASWHITDIRREDDVKALVAQVLQQHGRIHGLVNNAGGQYITPLASTSAKGWQAVIDTNLTGGFLVARECFNQSMQQHGGAVVNIASILGSVGFAGSSAYVAAKHGVAGFTKAVALELAQHGVTANCISPGYVWTPLVENQIPDTMKARGMTHDQVVNDVLLAGQPTKQFVTVEQVAATALFLCSDAAANITGTNISVDGGWTAQ